MDTVSVKLGNDLNRITRNAKIIMLLSLISPLNPPLFLIALLFFLFYFRKRKKLKHDQSLSSIFNRLKGKTTKELRSIKLSSNSLDQIVAGSILAHKTLVAVLIVIGIVITIEITGIGLYYLMGW